MTLIYILAESSVEIAGAGPHVETLHESWPGWPLALDHFHEFACPVPEVRAAARDVAPILDWRRVNQPEAVRVFGRRAAARRRGRSVAGRRAGRRVGDL